MRKNGIIHGIAENEEPVPRREHIVGLHEHCAELESSDPPQLLKTASEALRLSRTIDDGSLIARSLGWIGVYYHRKGKYTSSLRYMRRAITEAEKAGDTGQMATLYRVVGWSSYLRGEYVEAMQFYNRALELADPQDARKVATILSNVASLFRVLANYPKALELFNESIRLLEPYEDKTLIGTTLSSMAHIYYDLEDWDKAIEIYLKMYELVKGNGMRLGEATALSNIGEINAICGQGALGLEYLTMALEIYRELESRYGESAALHGMGIAHMKLGNYEKALAHFKEARVILDDLGHKEQYIENEMAVARAYIEMNMYDLALPILERALGEVQERGYPRKESALHEVIARAYEGVGNLPSALRHYKRYLQLRKELDNHEMRRAVLELEVRTEMERAEQERDIYRHKAERLEQDMEHRSQQLSTMALHLAQHNEFLMRLKHQVLPSAPATEGDLANELLKQIDESIEQEEGWRVFEQRFDQIHQGFIHTLAERYSALTPTELKICALLKINLASKEIARLFNSSVHTVETHRRRIRKKLALPNDINLTTFLLSM